MFRLRKHLVCTDPFCIGFPLCKNILKEKYPMTYHDIKIIDMKFTLHQKG